MYFLAIESSCDETAAAVFTEEPVILSSVIASQTDLHARFGGVVPEVAARALLVGRTLSRSSISNLRITS